MIYAALDAWPHPIGPGPVGLVAYDLAAGGWLGRDGLLRGADAFGPDCVHPLPRLPGPLGQGLRAALPAPSGTAAGPLAVAAFALGPDGLPLPGTPPLWPPETI